MGSNVAQPRTELLEHPSPHPGPAQLAPPPTGFCPAYDNEGAGSPRERFRCRGLKPTQISSQKVDFSQKSENMSRLRAESAGMENGDPMLAGTTQWPSPARPQPGPGLHGFFPLLSDHRTLHSSLSSRTLFSAPAQTLKHGRPSSGATIQLMNVSGPSPKFWGGTKLMSSSCQKTGSPWIKSPFWSNQLWPRRGERQCSNMGLTRGVPWVSRAAPPPRNELSMLLYQSFHVSSPHPVLTTGPDTGLVPFFLNLFLF